MIELLFVSMPIAIDSDYRVLPPFSCAPPPPLLYSITYVEDFVCVLPTASGATTVGLVLQDLHSTVMPLTLLTALFLEGGSEREWGRGGRKGR